jgi:hypothetical protein
LALLAPSSPTVAWTGSPTSYTTHDWLVDQAVKVLDGRSSDWFDAAIARDASDDPDTDGVPRIYHVYRDVGKRGGAVHKITEHYAAALRLYNEGVAARAAGNAATATARFQAASREIGWLSHYYTDILVPYHSHYDGLGQDTAHHQYEALVGQETRAAHHRPDWSSSRRTVSAIGSIRTNAIAAAAYSRSFYTELHALVVASPTKLTSRMSEITGLLLVRGANDLADIIWSISAGKGNATPVGTLRADVKWTYPVKNEPWQGVFVTATDTAGKPMEGLEVRVILPLPVGSTTTVRLYTDPKGKAKWAGPIGASPHLARQDVVVRATTDGRTVTGGTWWATAPVLASGSDGFRSSVDNATPKAGEYVTVRSTVRDTAGAPVVGIRVNWTWNYGSTTKVTSALTNSQGVATSKRLVGSTTTFDRVVIDAHVESGSANRYSRASFQRQAGDTTELYGGWFSDIWGSKFRDDIVWLAEAKITVGCAPERYCPDSVVTREQMATFLVRALQLPPSSKNYFTDDDASKHHAAINALAASGITSGCGDGKFCPSGRVTREQMASFLTRGLALPPSSKNYFTDDDASKHHAAINALAASGITSGCGDGKFCPRTAVTRGQMAAFIRRGLTR